MKKKGPRWLRVYRGLPMIGLYRYIVDTPLYWGLYSDTQLFGDSFIHPIKQPRYQDSMESKAGLLFVALTLWRGPKG